MATFRGLRGTLLDPFRNGAERQLDRTLLAQFEADIRSTLPKLAGGDYASAVALAKLPEKVRGYGHVRAAQAQAVAPERERLLAAVDGPAAQVIELSRRAG